MANLAAIVSLNQFFYKQRPLAMGIGSGGVGVGIFVFGFLQKHFVSLFTWRVIFHLTLRIEPIAGSRVLTVRTFALTPPKLLGVQM